MRTTFGCIANVSKPSACASAGGCSGGTKRHANSMARRNETTDQSGTGQWGAAGAAEAGGADGTHSMQTNEVMKTASLTKSSFFVWLTTLCAAANGQAQQSRRHRGGRRAGGGGGDHVRERHTRGQGQDRRAYENECPRDYAADLYTLPSTY